MTPHERVSILFLRIHHLLLFDGADHILRRPDVAGRSGHPAPQERLPDALRQVHHRQEPLHPGCIHHRSCLQRGEDRREQRQLAAGPGLPGLRGHHRQRRQQGQDPGTADRELPAGGSAVCLRGAHPHQALPPPVEIDQSGLPAPHRGGQGERRHQGRRRQRGPERLVLSVLHQHGRGLRAVRRRHLAVYHARPRR